MAESEKFLGLVDVLQILHENLLFFSPLGEKIKRWKWRHIEAHIHAPPFQPVTFALNKHVGIRLMSQDRIYVIFADERRSVRFNVGSKLKVQYMISFHNFEMEWHTDLQPLPT